MNAVYAALLLVISNCFMTYAWYGHLKQPGRPLVLAILLSWGVAFFEYIFQVPANRIGYTSLSGYQLKILQECIALFVFVVFASFYLGEGLSWRYAVSLVLILAAVGVAFYK
jgi:uncharacterized protein (DUF486 family)